MARTKVTASKRKATTAVVHSTDKKPKTTASMPGIIASMLAKPAKKIEEVFEAFKNNKSGFTCEWKYDGERCQIHVVNPNKIKLYSRNKNSFDERYPDIIEKVKQLIARSDCDVENCILDCESVAYDMVNDKILPFQNLARRKRKGVKIEDIEVQVCLYAFDLMYLNGQNLTKTPLKERKRLLHAHFPDVPKVFIKAAGRDCSTVAEIESELQLSIAGRTEGLMVKTLDSQYEIGARSKNWFKLKKDYIEGIGDSVDAVVIGAFHGTGNRSSTFGAFLIACFDKVNNEYQTVCKVGTGFSLDDLKKIKQALGKNEGRIKAPLSNYKYSEAVANEGVVWYKPRVVLEVKCADLQLSSSSKAAFGRVKDDRGISLRFPRFVRMRADKCGRDATSAEQILEMYKNQPSVQ